MYRLYFTIIQLKQFKTMAKNLSYAKIYIMSVL